MKFSTADKVMVLEDGQVKAFGPLEEGLGKRRYAPVAAKSNRAVF